MVPGYELYLMAIDPNLIGRWIHSLEEDSSENKTYRRIKPSDDINIVDAIELKTNGEFVRYTKPNQGNLESHEGHYQIFNNTIIVNFDNPYEDFILKIVSLDRDKLQVRKL
jgi:lipocalin-like protein